MTSPDIMKSPESAVGRGAVVVGFDGSRRSRQAARWAAREAASRGARLVVVNVIRGPFPEVVVTPVSAPLPQLVGERAVRAYTKDHLAELAAECAQVAPGVEVDTRAFDGHPAAVLAEVGREAQLLVVGSTGATGLARVFAGSVTSDLAHHFARPLVVVRHEDGDADADAAVDAAVDTGDGRVVVGVDGSEPSDRAVEFAVDHVARHGGTLIGVHATTGLPVDAMAPGGAWGQGLGLGLDVEQLRTAADALVAESFAGPLARHPGVRAERVVSLARPSQALVEEAEGASLLVVGSHGHGALRRALLGSVSHAMLHHAPCPLAVVRGDGSEH
ncbi:nucleotide-binding universal stress UspA family protein [Saccharothrix carnea]|uniref:Nucleotide-binding universal stress UspA family protein n=1 Tax=Saccharothrix carnea TaxID=1280637 RepID=A0A2P8IFI0_SACCR|nr:universal stress protein [Saccharothrix carnea]PSL57226.1 nucleotide-binding universal stress UspA family protein [Saccharothrix carnea]